MNLNQLEAFLYVSFTGSFSKAGEILFISQPTVSARIKSLEQILGCSLFNRNDKNATLTKEGEIFLPYAKTILEQMDEGIHSIQNRNLITEGEISISSVLIMADFILPKIISEFYKVFPKIKLTVHTGHTHNVLDMVLNYEVPLGITRSVNHPKLDSIHLFDDELVLVTYPSHPFYHKQHVSLQDVANEPLILFNRGSIDWTLINKAFHNLKIESNIVLETDNIKLVKQMIMKKMGIGILPRLSLEEELRADNLRVVNISDLPQLSRPYQIIFLKDTKIEGLLKFFVDFVSTQIKQMMK